MVTRFVDFYKVRFMKKFLNILWIGTALSILLGIGTARAVPMYYTFEGALTHVQDTAAESGLNLGDTVSYTLLVDYERAGTYTADNGYVYTQVDRTITNSDGSSTNWDYFYVDYISGSALGNLGTDYISEFNYGFTTTTTSFLPTPISMWWIFVPPIRSIRSRRSKRLKRANI